MNDLTQFHIKNKYYVSVRNLGDKLNGCIAKFPKNVLKDTPQLSKTYILYEKPYTIELFIVFEGHPVISKTINATNSNIRLLVLEDIFLQSYKLGLSKELIVVEGTDNNLFNMLQIEQTEQEKQLETQLCVQFRELLSGNVVTSNIEGYEQVLSCFENGGL